MFEFWIRYLKDHPNAKIIFLDIELSPEEIYNRWKEVLQ